MHSLGKTLLAFDLLHSVLQGQICLFLQVFPDFLLLHSSPMIDIIQGVIFLFFAAEQFLSGYRQKLVVKSAEEEIAARANLQKEG